MHDPLQITVAQIDCSVAINVWVDPHKSALSAERQTKYK